MDKVLRSDMTVADALKQLFPLGNTAYIMERLLDDVSNLTVTAFYANPQAAEYDRKVSVLSGHYDEYVRFKKACADAVESPK